MANYLNIWAYRGTFTYITLQFLWSESQVGFAELKETADDRVNIGGTIIGAPIIGQ